MTKEKAAPYVVNFTVIDVDQDGKISEAEFKDACQGGWIKDPSTVATVKGAK
jgi:Ca2+-binding EF-hand superfamily protein